MKIKVETYVKNYHGGPQIKVYEGDKMLKSVTLSQSGRQVIELEAPITFPSKLIIEHYGKNMARDTQLIDGKIIDDKGLVLEKIHIGDFVLDNELYLFDFIKEDGTVITNSNYIGYNGKYIINIDADNLMTWHGNLQKHFTTNLAEFDYDQFKKEIFEGNTYEVSY